MVSISNTPGKYLNCICILNDIGNLQQCRCLNVKLKSKNKIKSYNWLTKLFILTQVVRTTFRT